MSNLLPKPDQIASQDTVAGRRPPGESGRAAPSRGCWRGCGPHGRRVSPGRMQPPGRSW